MSILILMLVIIAFLTFIMNSKDLPRLSIAPVGIELDHTIEKKIKIEHKGNHKICVGIVLIGDAYAKDLQSLMHEKIDYFKKLNISIYILTEQTYFGYDTRTHHPAKSKIPFAYWLLQNTESEHVIILDADIGIVNSKLDISSFLSDQDIQMQRTSYVHQYPILQSSIIVLKKNDQLLNMLKSVWFDSVNQVRSYPGMQKIDFGEQTSLQVAIESGDYNIKFGTLPDKICCLTKSKCNTDTLFVHYIGSRHTNNINVLHAEFKNALIYLNKHK